ncbi:MAG: hypothetical protein J5379_04665 [Clostridiales bacterium]|nr:hypothetical protein [Clostridiales bacterium]
MINYLYNARDIAAYFKWAGVSSHQEKEYLHYIFQIGRDILAKPLTYDYDEFEKAVYRDLYYLWSEGFENEYSDIATIAPKGAVSLICDQEFITLESYMKLLALHLIFSRNLPYVHVNFTGLMLPLGLKGDFVDYERNVVIACETLHLVTQDVFSQPFDLHLGIPDEMLCLCLEPEFRKSLASHDDFRKRFIKQAASRLQELKKTSAEIQEKEEKKKQRLLKRKLAREAAKAEKEAQKAAASKAGDSKDKKKSEGETDKKSCSASRVTKKKEKKEKKSEG